MGFPKYLNLLCYFTPPWPIDCFFRTPTTKGGDMKKFLFIFCMFLSASAWAGGWIDPTPTPSPGGSGIPAEIPEEGIPGTGTATGGTGGSGVGLPREPPEEGARDLSTVACFDLPSTPRLQSGSIAGDLVICGLGIHLTPGAGTGRRMPTIDLTYCLLNQNIENASNNYWKSTVLMTRNSIGSSQHYWLAEQQLHCNRVGPRSLEEYTYGGTIRRNSLSFTNIGFLTEPFIGVTLEIDANNSILESNETNNTLECTSFIESCNTDQSIPLSEWAEIPSAARFYFSTPRTYLPNGYRGPCYVWRGYEACRLPDSRHMTPPDTRH